MAFTPFSFINPTMQSQQQQAPQMMDVGDTSMGGSFYQHGTPQQTAAQGLGQALQRLSQQDDKPKSNDSNIYSQPLPDQTGMAQGMQQTQTIPTIGDQSPWMAAPQSLPQPSWWQRNFGGS